MSGSFSLIREYIGYYYPQYDPKAVFRLLGWTCFFISAVIAWALKQRELLAEKNRNEYPEIVGKIEDAYVDVRTNRASFMTTFVTLWVSLVNVRPAVATIHNYKLTIKLDDKEYEAKNIPFRDIKLERPEYDRHGLPTYGEGVVEEFTDLGSDKEKLTPRERGVRFNGWLRFATVEKLVFPHEKYKITLTVIDGYDRPQKPIEQEATKHPLGEFMQIISVGRSHSSTD